MPTTDYDISKAFKRIENDLLDSMMRNLKRHKVEENKEGLTWEQWQAIQLQELEEYRKKNAKLFTGDFKSIDRKVDTAFRRTAKSAQTAEEHRLMDNIKQKKFTPTVDKGGFFRLNEGKLEALITATQADFTRAEYALLRQANDQYRKIIFDAMTYANITNDYNKAVDMATSDFLKKGYNCVVYKNGARHTIADYARMAIRTGNKRAYLMGEGNAHDRYGLHTVRVNKRTHACPKCVGFLGKLLIDDVYGGGTRAEATAQGIPTLSDAMRAGFLHPNCKDIYSVYIEGVSRPAKPWSQEEIGEIVGEYNQEQELQHAIDMQETYQRMAKYSLDPENQQRYQGRADGWQARAEEIRNEPAPPVPTPQPTPQVPNATPFTDDEKEALEWYVSGDGMWINQYLRGNMGDAVLDETEQQLLGLLESATGRPLEGVDKLYRSVDAKVIFEGLSDSDLDDMMQHLLYGDSVYDKGAYSQGIKKRMESALAKAKGETLTEKGFMSTTIDKKVAVEWGDFTDASHPVVIELDTKGKKLKGADLDFLDLEDDPQRERLLGKGVRYKVNDISVATDANGNKYIKVSAEFIDQAEDAVEDIAEEAVDTFDRNNINWSASGKVLEKQMKDAGVEYREVKLFDRALSENEIIERIAGGDLTEGSCMSLAQTYIGNKCGYDVRDFRGGKSGRIMSLSEMKISSLNGITAIKEQGSTIRPAKALLAKIEEGKEYYFITGRHASIVRNINGDLQYLELQSAFDSGWHSFEEDVVLFKDTPFERVKHYTTSDKLKDRFGCGSRSAGYSYLIDIEQYQGSDEFRELLGYINTAEDAQKKGALGNVK